jgi:integrase
MDHGSVVRDDDGNRRKIRGGPIAANRTLAAVRSLFNFAVRRGIIDATPVSLVQGPGEENRRDRTLTADEIRVVWAAAERLGYPFGSFFQIALITGQRRSEVAGMRWAHLDFDEALWTLPAEATKVGWTQVVPLPSLAVDMLRKLPGKAYAAGPTRFVFTTDGDAPVSGFSKAKLRLDRIIGEARSGEALAPWTIHDLRRTAATEMARLGVSRFVIGRVLNHADRGVTGIYDRHAYLQEKRHALETWARYLGNLTQLPGENAATAKRA